MGTKYTTNAQQLWAKSFKDAPGAAGLLLDVADEKIASGVLEPLEDAVAAGVKTYLTLGLERIQGQMGQFAKFAGDLADDPEAAVSFILAKADEAIEAGAAEPLMDTVAAIAKPYAVTALAAQQAKLAAVQIAAED